MIGSSQSWSLKIRRRDNVSYIVFRYLLIFHQGISLICINVLHLQCHWRFTDNVTKVKSSIRYKLPEIFPLYIRLHVVYLTMVKLEVYMLSQKRRRISIELIYSINRV